MAPRWLGIDLGGTYIKWELLGEGDQGLGSGRVDTPTSGHLAVTDAIVDLCSERAADSEVTGIGIAVPGHLSPIRDSITLLPNVSGQWSGFPLRSYVAERIGLTPTLLNDARAFAAAELVLGAARGRDDVLFATIGTGIGGAVAVGGVVVNSARDNFGEIGHLTAVVGGEPCGCGSAGCIEAYAGGAYLLARAEKRGCRIDRGPSAIPALAASAVHDPMAARVLSQAYDIFGVGISSACAYTGSRCVVVGGAVGAELPGYLQGSRYHLSDRHGLLGDVDVRAAALGARAGALGAAVSARLGHSSTSKELVQHR